MIRQQAFEKTGNKMLKGALHCHTTRSDGSLKPEEVMLLLKQYGYDFLSVTDHNIYNLSNPAPDMDMVVLPGAEIGFDYKDMMEKMGPVITKWEMIHCTHEICLGPSSEDGNGFGQDERISPVWVDSYKDIQPRLDNVHAKGNMTIYCHPQWSSTPAREFENLKGNFAMEIWNSNNAINWDMDKDAMYWDELLRQNIRLWGVASDDGHQVQQYGNGWVRVNARKDLNSILAALKDGCFYASTGPEIYDFYINDDSDAVIECSPAVKIRFHYGYAPTHVARPAAGETTITRAAFHVPSFFSYIRASVTDAEGRLAWTQPIFLD